ncbi:hypothetical protein BH09BAC4_BH09BAC4_29050 [soil metagenome]
MNESIRIIWGILGLLIGAGLLTYLTQDSDQPLSYEVDRKKKSKKKKRGVHTQYPLSAGDDETAILTINAPSSVEQPDQKSYNY